MALKIYRKAGNPQAEWSLYSLQIFQSNQEIGIAKPFRLFSIESANTEDNHLISPILLQQQAIQRRQAKHTRFVATTHLTWRHIAFALLTTTWTFSIFVITTPTIASDDIQSISLETSDGVSLAMSFYPGPEEPVATVMLVHDIGGSEADVRVLAAGLQKAGCAVAVPDLRGHGGSNDRSQRLSAKRLRARDLQMIAASGHGKIREQSRVAGDLETVYRWLNEQEAAGEVKLDRLCVIGSGLGGTLASLWVATDWAWQPNTRGAQGQNVKSLILISPKLADKGISIKPALALRTFIDRQVAQPIMEKLPILIISGKNDPAAEQIFQQLKSARPMSWYKQLASGTKSQAEHNDIKSVETGPLVFAQIDTTLRADKLASLPSGSRTPLALINWFLKEAVTH